MGQTVVLLGAAVELLGVIPYLRDTLNGATKPNRATWLLWSLAPLIGAAAAFSDGAAWPAIPVLVAGLTPLTVFGASLVNSRAAWRLGPLDYLCGALSVMALAVWSATARTDVAIVFAIAADALATLPTLRKSWLSPESETASAYLTTSIGAMAGLAALQTWRFSECAFLIYLATMFTLLPGVIFYRRAILANRTRHV